MLTEVYPAECHIYHHNKLSQTFCQMLANTDFCESFLEFIQIIKSISGSWYSQICSSGTAMDLLVLLV